MYTGKKAKRGKVRIKFVQRSPEISYRLTNQLESTKVKLYDISETGFSFTINEKDEVTRVGDILFIDFNQLNGGHSTCFTARVKRFQVVEDKLIFAAEFISISKSFQLQIAKWSRVYVKTGYFLLERRSPISNILRVSKKPMQ
ncbi:MAG: PilZ domain-containing protein, partial [Bdellovibrionales bacterium]|nr:PilZ domain-containing protein [Bdellovibrionales bacterium]